MSRWTSAAGRLNRSADAFYGEGVTILRPGPGSAYVKGQGEPQIVRDGLSAVISEGLDDFGADGSTPGSKGFNRQLAGGAIEASFMRTVFASRADWPKTGDLIRADERPGQPLFEAVGEAADDGDRINVPLVRR